MIVPMADASPDNVSSLKEERQQIGKQPNKV
jgi:hypothetical protein